MRVLITGARAPISADIARVINKSGHTVYMTDCLDHPIGSFSPFIAAYIKMRAPTLFFQEFKRTLIETVDRLGIDRIIPTSEEVFWLAQIPEITGILFAPHMKALDRLHNKYTFGYRMADMGYGAPVNMHITSMEEAMNIKEADAQKLIFKPEYSRFGTKVIFSPTHAQLKSLDYTRAWFAQSIIEGEEVCIYSIAERGKCLMHTAYRPKYKAGSGASIYFDPISDPRITEFVNKVISKFHLTGQISFDVMLTKKGLVALECNPRGTSGVHLVAQDCVRFCAALLGDHYTLNTLPAEVLPKPSMLNLAFFIYQWRNWYTGNTRKDYLRAQDAMKAAGITWKGQLQSTVELIKKSKNARMDPLEWSTVDFEFNGFEFLSSTK